MCSLPSSPVSGADGRRPVADVVRRAWRHRIWRPIRSSGRLSQNGPQERERVGRRGLGSRPVVPFGPARSGVMGTAATGGPVWATVLEPEAAGAVGAEREIRSAAGPLLAPVPPAMRPAGIRRGAGPRRHQAGWARRHPATPTIPRRPVGPSNRASIPGPSAQALGLVADAADASNSTIRITTCSGDRSPTMRPLRVTRPTHGSVGARAPGPYRAVAVSRRPSAAWRTSGASVRTRSS